MISRRDLMLGSMSLAAASAFDPRAALAQEGGTLRIGMTLSDIPLPNGQTDQGAEGMRFVGVTVFDALIQWDLTRGDRPSSLVPALAESWTVDPADRTRWTVRLRPNVRFHDGSTFDASAVIWNFDKILKEDAPQFDRRQAGQGRGRIPSIKAYRALDPLTVEFTTGAPNALTPYELSWIQMSSPAQWEKVGRSWDNFLKEPSGTGPWRVERYVPRERLELVANRD